ncbi:MAG: hypothetical protein R3194_01365 [Limnobacter sp.]|nr:hypothetical protein [Limnobacter sp.]
MKIAILRDESASVERLFRAVEQVFHDESPQIYFFNLLSHLRNCGESFDMVITDLSVKDASREAIQEFLMQQGEYLTQTVLLLESQSSEHDWMANQDVVAVSSESKQVSLARALEALGEKVVPMTHINFDAPKEHIRWSCTGEGADFFELAPKSESLK